jgi:transposase
MAINKDSCLVSRLEVVDTGRRRRWSEDEKLRIVAESFAGPRLVSVTARRHGVSRSLLFSWRKAYRAGQLGEVAGFVAAIVAPEVRKESARAESCRIEIVSANGRRVIVDGAVNVEALLRIVAGLERLP